MLWRCSLAPIAMPVMRQLWRVSRGMTLGVRGLVTDGEGRVLLVEHSYMPGWRLPGGGVEHDETAAEALSREVSEEAGIAPTSAPTLLSVHVNRRFPHNHILLFRVDAWRAGPPAAGGEIRAIGWFAPDALPDGAGESERARLREALHGAPADPMW